VLAAALVGAAVTASAQDRRRSLYVTVVDEKGQPVTALGPADFDVREDNVAREVLDVRPADAPLQIAILVDNSTAARNDIQNIRPALEAFVAALLQPSDTGRRNEIAIITLADRPTLQTDQYTSDRATVDKAIGHIFAQPQSGTYLLEGIMEASRGLAKRNAERPVIVAITSEGPELSDRHYATVLDPLRASNAAFYAVVFGPPSGDTSLSARDRGVVLDQGTRDTGGRRENVLTSMALESTLQTLAAQLTHTLLVTYAQPESLIPPEHVTVAVKRPGLSARGTRVVPPNAPNPVP
jgi:VWFA-related protein